MAPNTRSQQRKRSERRTSFPWMELDFDMRSVIISKVAPDDLFSLIVAITFPGTLPPAGSPFSDSFRDEALAFRFLTSGACEGSDIVASAGYFDFEARCAALWKRSPETLTASFHRDSTAGYARRLKMDVARLAELGSFKRRCASLPSHIRERDVYDTIDTPVDRTQDWRPVFLRVCRDVEIRFTFYMTRQQMSYEECQNALVCRALGEPSREGSTTVSFSFSGDCCRFCREARWTSTRRSRTAPSTHTSFRAEHAHVFDAWRGAPYRVRDDELRVVRATERGQVCAENGWSAFEKAACGYFEPRTDVVEGTHVDAPPAPRSPPHPSTTWKTLAHDLEAVMEVFVAGSERPVIRRNSAEPYGLTCREGSEGPDEYKVFDWDGILRLMLKVDSGDHEDAWEYNGVAFLLGFHRAAGRRRPAKSARPYVAETLEDEEAWFSRRGTTVPTLEFLKRLLA